MSDLTAVVLAVALLVGNASFVGAEFALVSARRTQIEPRAADGSRRARVTLRAMERVSLMMAGAQLGITVCSLGLGAVGEPAVAHLLEPLFDAVGVPEALLHVVSFAIAMSIVVFAHMVLGEMVPKNIALAGPTRSALLLGPPLYGVVRVLKPLIWLLNMLANVVLRLLRVQPQDEVSTTFTREEVAGLIEESRREGLIDDTSGELMAGALELEVLTMGDVAVRRDKLVTVPEGSSVQQVQDLCASTGFSRFPVRSASGGLAGYLHVKDLLAVPPERLAEPFDAKRIRPFVTVTPSSLLREGVARMQRRGGHMGRVVDPETGTITSVVMLEDALEEMIGEVGDATQHDPTSGP